MTVQHEPMVIVGAGLARAKGAEALRQEGFDGRIILIGQEPERPYGCPDLSKDYLTGASEKEKIYVHPEQWCADYAVELRLSTRVTSINPHNRLVNLARNGAGPLRQAINRHRRLCAVAACSGRRSTPRILPSSNRGLPAAQVHPPVSPTGGRGRRRLDRLGSSCCRMGSRRGRRNAGARGIAGATGAGAEMAQVFADLHHDHGVDLRCGVQIAEVNG